MNAIPNMAELQRWRVNRSGCFECDHHLGQVDVTDTSGLTPTAGDVKAQGVRLADVLVFGPLMIYSGMGRTPPQWVRLGLIIIGAGTILYNLHNYIQVQRARVAAGVAEEGTVLGQMAHGPMHRVADLRRSGGIQDVYARGPGRLRGRW